MHRIRWIVFTGVVLRLTLAGGVAWAQEEGVRFEQGLAWQEVQANAHRERKYIFLAWPALQCAPCEARSRQLYAQPEVGRFFNAKFIAVRMPADPSATGEAAAGSWAAVARDLREQYDLPSIPVWLFLSPDGRAVHQARGGTAEALLTAAADALDPRRQYYTLVAQYRHGRRDLAVLPYLTRSAQALGDADVATAAATEYLRRAPERELLTREHLPLVAAFTTRSSDRGFALFRRQAARINQIMDSAGYAERVVDAIIAQEEIASVVPPDEPLPDWEAIARTIARKYSAAEAERIVSAAKVQRWRDPRAQLWAEEAKALLANLKRQGPDTGGLGQAMLNNAIWSVIFEHSTDADILNQGIRWMQVLLKIEPNKPTWLDTYANLLYKVGRKEEALMWEEKALNAEEERAVSEQRAPDPVFQETLAKMRNGEPTWPQE